MISSIQKIKFLHGWKYGLGRNMIGRHKVCRCQENLYNALFQLLYYCVSCVAMVLNCVVLQLKLSIQRDPVEFLA